MEIKLWKAYIRDCEIFGWVPTFAGANDYKRKVKQRYRHK